MQFSNSKHQPHKRKRTNITYYNIICIGHENSGRKSIFEKYKNNRAAPHLKGEDPPKTEQQQSPLTMGFLSLVTEEEKKSMDEFTRKRALPQPSERGDGSMGFLSFIDPAPVHSAKSDGTVGFLSLLADSSPLLSPLSPSSSFSSSSLLSSSHSLLGLSSLSSSSLSSPSPSLQRQRLSFSHANKQVNVWLVEEFASVNIDTDDCTGFLFVYDVTSKESFGWIERQMAMVSKLSSFHSSILLGAKCDDLREVAYHEADKLAKRYQLPYLECSAKENIRIEEAIGDLLCQLEYEYEAPIQWENTKREIKEKLSVYVIHRNYKKLLATLTKKHPNALGKAGWAPIHVACWEGCFEIVFNFIRACPGCVHTRGRDDWTPLHIASRMGFMDIAQLLLDSGANIMERDSLGRLPTDCRLRSHRDYLLSRFLSRSRNQSPSPSLSLSSLPSDSSELDLSHANLSSLPPSFSLFTQLTWLSLSHNQLKEIGQIGQCKQLQTLILSHNLLSQLPDDLLLLLRLEHLDLRSNCLSSLPLDFGLIKTLKRCYLSHNCLTYLPSSMENFEKSIEALDLYANPLNTLPPDLIPKLGDVHPSEMHHLFAYLRDMKEGQQEYNRVKIMLVGEGNVGKTSLSNCFAELHRAKPHHRLGKREKKKEPTDTIATDGIDISEVVVPLQGKEIVWDVWDYAGQEIYYTTHQFFLTKRAIYLVIFNLLDRDLTRVEYWLNSIHSRARGSPVILVGTHADSKDCTEEYLNNFSNHLMLSLKPERFKSKLGVKSVKAIYFVSSRKRQGIKDLMEGIKEIVTKQKWEGQLFPTSWVKLEQAVTKLKRAGSTPFFQWEEFKRMAESVGVPPHSVKDATLFLHTIGCLCYFDEALSGLSEIVIIDPQFLTNVMSSVITLKHRFGQVANAEGIITSAQLPHIWKDFPSEIHPMLIKLLECFEITFRLPAPSPSEPQRIVIPSLLSERQPNLKERGWSIALGQKTEQLVVGRIFQFDFLPLGFFPRLIVRNCHIANVEIESIWRHGMLLLLAGAKALLRFNPTRYRLTLDIASSFASFPDSVKLLRLLVENIESTIEGWYESAVEISVPCPHCVSQGSYEPWRFSLTECLQAISDSVGYVLCQSIRRIRIDLVAPDLSFVDFQKLVVPYDSLRFASVIGQGAFGTVYKGSLGDSPSPVAIKQLSFKSEGEEEGRSNAELLSRFSEFQREVWIMSCLKHKNVCGLIAITNNPMAMVIDYLPLGDLYRLIERQGRGEGVGLENMQVKLKLVYEIAKGIHHLHSLSPPIIHRDLRSPNIFILSLNLDAPVSAKIGDFGLSRLISSPLAGGDFNANWLAPEVMKGDQYDHKLDVYSFGIVMWEILSLRKPFEEYDHRFMGKPKSMFYADVIRGLRPSIPPECDADYRSLMIRCWDGLPSSRPDLSSILQSLERILTRYSVPIPLDDLPPLPSSSPSPSSSDTSLPGSFIDSVDQTLVLEFAERMAEPAHPQSIQKIITVTTEKDDVTIWTATASGDILLWDSLKHKFIMQFQVTKERIYDMQMVGQEVWVATSNGAIISVSTSKDHKHLFTITEHNQAVRAMVKLESSPNLPFMKGAKPNGSSAVITGDLEGTVNIWLPLRKKPPKLVNKFKVPQPVGAMLHKGSTVYIGTDGPIYLFDINTNTLNGFALNGHTNLVTGLLIAGANLWSCSNDGSLRIWDLHNNTCLQELKAHSSKVLCMTSFRGYVITGSFDTILAVWDATTGALLQELKGIHRDGIRSVTAFGDTVLSGGLENDPVLCVWKLAKTVGRKSLLGCYRY